MEIRWLIKKSGERVLQWKYPEIAGLDEDGVCHYTGRFSPWEDVEIVYEDKQEPENLEKETP